MINSNKCKTISTNKFIQPNYVFSEIVKVCFFAIFTRFFYVHCTKDNSDNYILAISDAKHLNRYGVKTLFINA